MKRCPPTWYRAAWAALLVSLLAVGAYAQIQSGNIFGNVVDTDGSALPGVTVTLTGVGAPQVTVTDAEGRFRFLNLPPARYSLRAELAGFGTATRAGISVNLGRNSEVTMTLNPSVAQTITVTAEAPLLDTRRTGTGATVTEVELEQVPTARDPWVILQQVPGVLMDRINVGGNESGNQSQFVSKGITSDQATYSIDGVNTTDMIATGGSSAYFDFGSFDEVQITTSGTDPAVQTAGAQINIVTKRGTNDFTGSGRYYLTPGETQGERKIPEEVLNDPLGPYLGKTNEINKVTEGGIEVGGPILRDRLWAWVAYSDNQIDLFTSQDFDSVAAGLPRFSDNTNLETINAKLNAQIGANNSATFFYVDNQKTKQGRNAGPTRPPATTWNQGGFGPKGTYKLEDTHIFSPNFYVTGKYSKVNGGFGLWANSGGNCSSFDCINDETAGQKSTVLDLATGEWRNTFPSVQGLRPQEQVRLDNSAFFNTGALSHELKFGFGYRTAGTEGLSLYPNDQLILDLTNFGLPQFGITYFYATGPYKYDYSYKDLYVGDTMLWGNLTLQAGLRFDIQDASAPDQVGPANPLVAEYLPAVTVDNSEIDSMEWKSISPRLGLTYALGPNKQTLLRAAYNQYVGQLGSNSSGFTAAVPAWYRYVGFYTFDENSNDVIEPGEVLFEYGIYGDPVGFDPNNPSNVNLVRIDKNIDPQRTREYLLGIEHELLRDFVVGLNYTHRDMDNFLWTRAEKTRGAGDYFTSADYELAYLLREQCDPDGDGTTENCAPGVEPFSVPVYQLKAGLEPLYGVLTNRDGYTQDYDGLELSLVKRMANRWMVRGNFSWNDWKQNVEAEAIVDPTPIRNANGCSICDGADVVAGSGTISGAKGAVWINSEWAMNVAGLYQIPVIEATFGVNFNMRQGYPILYTRATQVTEDLIGVPHDIAKNVLIADVTEYRLPNPYSLDLRLAKDFRFQGIGLELSVDAFNITNEQVRLQRNADLFIASQDIASDTGDHIREIQNPRVLRFGARFTF